jgi:hypothetical protein
MGLPKAEACRLASVEGRTKKADTLVEGCGNGFSDAVSITAISTNEKRRSFNLAGGFIFYLV